MGNFYDIKFDTNEKDNREHLKNLDIMSDHMQKPRTDARNINNNVIQFPTRIQVEERSMKSYGRVASTEKKEKMATWKKVVIAILTIGTLVAIGPKILHKLADGFDGGIGAAYGTSNEDSGYYRGFSPDYEEVDKPNAK